MEKNTCHKNVFQYKEDIKNIVNMYVVVSKPYIAKFPNELKNDFFLKIEEYVNLVKENLMLENLLI
jgi:hypothetical protein